MDLLKGLGYMTIWAVGFIAVAQVSAPFFRTMQDFIGGQNGGA